MSDDKFVNELTQIKKNSVPWMLAALRLRSRLWNALRS